MKTLQDVTQETGISYHTLVKYTGLGLVPKSQRVWRGRKGSESLYPDNTIYIINLIMEEKKTGLTLRKIAENRRVERAVTAFASVINDFPGYRFTRATAIESEERFDGSIVVKVEMVGKRI